MASITQYRGKTWRAVIRKTGFAPTSKTFDTKAAAQSWATRTEASMITGTHRDVIKEARTQTVRELLEKFRDEVTPLRKGGDWEVTRLNKMLREAEFVQRRLDQIEPGDIRVYRDDRLKLVSPSSVNREMNLISGVFTHAIKEWGAPLSANPVHLVARPKGTGRQRNRRWTEDEIAKFLKVSGWQENVKPTVGREYVGWAVLVAIETAMRMGELCSLTVGNFHPSERFIFLDDTKNGDSRNVPLSRKALEYFEVLTQGLEKEDRIFPYETHTLGVFFNRIRKEAGLADADLHFHDTRHEAATRLSKKLSNVLELSAVTGHRSLQSLKRYYNPTPIELASKLD